MSPIEKLQADLKKHFETKTMEIKSAALQALSLNAKQDVSILESYLQHVETLQQNLASLSLGQGPEKYAQSVSKYLIQQYKLEGAKSSVGEDNDFSIIFSGKKGDESVLELNALQKAAAEVAESAKDAKVTKPTNG